ncbi:LysR family transcriptional regulator [Janthinobacterium sp. GW460P]|uniref:LysR family transcriptional regulator n=1 Tax=unclassified Janthinobacterium TaxID=2610881 RepID=UPI000A3212E4|nr:MULTISPECIES: LysR family transcriptional regulator [unclassified Janthinobacterium]MCC7701975.1 LysR family transcriptional regulator [Janthinobacterium sp. GW460P]MCC7707483.1 LysR family transcriptional regulator [Janthinobacterium sp. GW460W]
MNPSIAWEYYRSLLAVLKHGSLSGAARALAITQPTVGRHIAALEQALGATLFTRSQLGLLPTEVALALRPHAETMEHTAALMERAASSQGQGVAGVVRIAASEVVGVEVLPPILARLRERYPGLIIELVLSNKVQDLLRREADIAVRMLRPRQEQLVARKVGEIELGLHAHADYLARHAVIGYDEASPFVRNAGAAFQGFTRENFAWRSDSDLAQLAWIRAGAGIGVCQAGLAVRDPALRRVLPQAFSLPMETWVTMHEDLRGSLRCRATFDALAEGLQAYVATQPLT